MSDNNNSKVLLKHRPGEGKLCCDIYNQKKSTVALVTKTVYCIDIAWDTLLHLFLSLTGPQDQLISRQSIIWIEFLETTDQNMQKMKRLCRASYLTFSYCRHYFLHYMDLFFSSVVYLELYLFLKILRNERFAKLIKLLLPFRIPFQETWFSLFMEHYY